MKYIFKIFNKEKNIYEKIDSTVVLPFFITETLDESLDTGHIDILASQEKDPIKPFTRVKIEIFNTTVTQNPDKEIFMLVIADTVTLTRYSKKYIYNHSIELIELTKELERIPSQNLAFSRPVEKSSFYLGYIKELDEEMTNGVLIGNTNNPEIYLNKHYFYVETNRAQFNQARHGVVKNENGEIIYNQFFEDWDDWEDNESKFQKIKNNSKKDFSEVIKLKNYFKQTENIIEMLKINLINIKNRLEDLSKKELRGDNPQVKNQLLLKFNGVSVIKINDNKINIINTNISVKEKNNVTIEGYYRYRKEENHTDDNIIGKIDYFYNYYEFNPNKTNFIIYLNTLSKIKEKKEPINFQTSKNNLLENAISRLININTNKKYTLLENNVPKLLSPEFYISGKNLFESLLLFGGYMHSIPRLNENNKIVFERLGESEKIDDYLKNAQIIGIRKSLDGNNYFNYLDTEVFNISDSSVSNKKDINSDNEITKGSIKEIISFRTHSDNERLTTETAIFKTKYNILKIIDAKIKLKGSNNGNSIMKYLYEAHEYETLSDNDSVENKYTTFAKLRYQIGTNVIDKFFHRPKKTFSYTLPKQTPIEVITNTDINDSNFDKYCLEIEYIPYINTRIRQYKFKDKNDGGCVYYNQGANTVESSFYGANIKGVINRLGNEQEEITFLSKVPIVNLKPGKIIKNKYISVIKSEYNKISIKNTLSLIKDFNKLSEHLSLANDFRIYDISEKHNINRYIQKDIIVDLSHTRKKTVTEDISLEKIKGSDKKVLSAFIKFKITDNEIQYFEIPATHIAVGTSILFSFAANDNYSIGTSVENINGAKYSHRIRYGDIYGFIESCSYKLAYESLNLDETPKSKKERYDQVNSFNNKNEIIELQKDGAETLNFIMQVHFTNKDGGIVVGDLFGNAIFENFKDIYHITTTDSEYNIFNRWSEEDNNELKSLNSNNINIKDQYLEINLENLNINKNKKNLLISRGSDKDIILFIKDYKEKINNNKLYIYFNKGE